MTGKITAFILSFLLGLYLWFPYRTVYSGVLKRLSSELPLDLQYSVEDASLTSVTLKGLTLKYSGLTLSEDSVTVRIDPFGLLSERDLIALRKKGLFLKIGYRGGLYFIDALFDDYKDPNAKGAVFNGTVSMVVDRGTGLLKDGKVDMEAQGLSINTSGVKMNFKKLILKCSVKDGVIELRRLTTQGEFNAQITGRIVQDVKDIRNSRLDLDIRYQVGKKTLMAELKTRLGSLLTQSSLLRP